MYDVRTVGASASCARYNLRNDIHPATKQERRSANALDVRTYPAHVRYLVMFAKVLPVGAVSCRNDMQGLRVPCSKDLYHDR